MCHIFAYVIHRLLILVLPENVQQTYFPPVDCLVVNDLPANSDIHWLFFVLVIDCPSRWTKPDIQWMHIQFLTLDQFYFPNRMSDSHMVQWVKYLSSQNKPHWSDSRIHRSRWQSASDRLFTKPGLMMINLTLCYSKPQRHSCRSLLH